MKLQQNKDCIHLNALNIKLSHLFIKKYEIKKYTREIR